jgi:hypothetical protein
MPLRLEAVDPQNPNTVALVSGPIALFAVGEIPAHLTRAQLLAASAVSRSSQDWVAAADGRSFTVRPLAALRDETYRLYKVDG